MARRMTMVLIEADAGRMVGRLMDTDAIAWMGSGLWDPADLLRLLQKRRGRCTPTQQAEVDATVRRLRMLRLTDTVTVRRASVAEARMPWRIRA